MSKKQCQNCRLQPIDKEKGKGDLLCGKCLKKCKRGECHFCRKQMRVLSKDKDKPAKEQYCYRCADEFILYGEPKKCLVCDVQAAFNAPCCRHCTKAQKEGIKPTICGMCHKKSAFIKSEDQTAKVDGQTLCYVCTLKYKLVKEGKKRGKSIVEDKEKDKEKVEEKLEDEDEDGSKMPLKDSLKRKRSEIVVVSGKDKKTELSKDTPAQEIFNHYLELQKAFAEYKEQTRIQAALLFETKNNLEDLKQKFEKQKVTLQDREKEIARLNGLVTQNETLYTAKIESLKNKFGDQIIKLNESIQDLTKKDPFSSKTPSKKPVVKEADLDDDDI